MCVYVSVFVLAQCCTAAYQTNGNHRQGTYIHAYEEIYVIDSPIDRYCKKQLKCNC